MSGNDIGGFKIDEFCEAYGISRATYHKLQRQGRAPAVMVLGPIARRITFAAAREWQERMSRPEGDEAAVQRAERRMDGGGISPRAAFSQVNIA